MTDTDRLAALLHEHWLEDPYVSDGAIFASCTCGEHVPIPAVTVENRDPVMAFSEHIAARLIAAGVTLAPQPDTASRELREALRHLYDWFEPCVDDHHSSCDTNKGYDYSECDCGLDDLMDDCRAALAATEEADHD